MRAQARGELRRWTRSPFHLDGALFHGHPGVPAVQAHIETGPGYGDASLSGVDHERPCAVVGDAEHHFTRFEHDLSLPGAVPHAQASRAIELQLRAVRQLDITALAQGGLQVFAMVFAGVLPATPAQSKGGGAHSRRQGLLQETPTGQMPHRLRNAQRLQALGRDVVGGLPQPLEQAVLRRWRGSALSH